MEAQKSNFASRGATASGPAKRACAMWAWTKAAQAPAAVETDGAFTVRLKLPNVPKLVGLARRRSKRPNPISSEYA